MCSCLLNYFLVLLCFLLGLGFGFFFSFVYLMVNTVSTGRYAALYKEFELILFPNELSTCLVYVELIAVTGCDKRRED